MGKIIGLGGVFLKADDPKKLAEWYQEFLGINFNGNSYIDLPFSDSEGKISAGYNVLSFFHRQTEYFNPTEKDTMINLRVEDLDGLLNQLRTKGVETVGEPVDEEYGKFGWILDPEGNKIELWEPPA